MEIYQWLFRKSGFNVNSVGYFLYVNGSKQGNFYRNGALGVMHFDTTLIRYVGDDSWVDGAVESAVKCLHSGSIPESGIDCGDCRYFESRKIVEENKSFLKGRHHE